MPSNFEFDEFDLKRITDVVFGEAGGGPPEEVLGVISTILNRYSDEGDLDKVLSAYAAYSQKSPEYMKARTGQMNAYEKMIYLRDKDLVNKVIGGEVQIIPDITHFENVDAFGKPYWADSLDSIGKLGRQVFYKPKRSRAKSLGR